MVNVGCGRIQQCKYSNDLCESFVVGLSEFMFLDEQQSDDYIHISILQKGVTCHFAS